MSEIISVKNLRKNFSDKVAIEQLNLSVVRGEVYGLVGPDGAGKSTLIKLLLGILSPDKGQVALYNYDVEENHLEVSVNTGSVVENPVFYEHLNPRDNLALYCEYMGYYSASDIEDSLELLHVDAKSDRPLSRYSMSKRKLIAFARAIVTKPELVILDDIFSGLDATDASRLRHVIQLMNKSYGITFLITGSVLGEIEKVGSKVGIMIDGQIKDELDLSAIKNSNQSYVEIQCEDSSKALLLLAEMNYENYRLYGDKTLRIYDAIDDYNTFLKQLIDGAIKITGFNIINNSLEEHFIRLVKGGIFNE